MKKLFFIALIVFLNELHAQVGVIGCATPTFAFTDFSLNPVSNTISCNSGSLLLVSMNPAFTFSTNGAIIGANTPCLRFITSVTAANAATNTSLLFQEGTNPPLGVCSGTCNFPVTNNVNFGLYAPGLLPSASHSYTLCNVAVSPNITYSVTSCYDNTILNSGTWNMSSPNSCQSFTIPANSAIGVPSYSISPAILPAAFLNLGNGRIAFQPNRMAPGTYTLTYNFVSSATCSVTHTTTIVITNPYLGPGSDFNIPPSFCSSASCLNLNPQLAGTAFGGGTWSGTGVSAGSFCPSLAGVGTFPITYSVGLAANPGCEGSTTKTFSVLTIPVANAGTSQSITCLNSSVVLNGSGGGTYSWSNSVLGNGFSSISNPTVSTPGTYSLVVNDGTCSSIPQTVVVTNNVTPPAIPSTTLSSTINCVNSTVTVTTSNPSVPGATYVWSGPGIIGSSTNTNVVVNQTGTYNYTVTNPLNGCTSNSFVTVTSNTSIPATTASTSGSVTCNPSIAINLTSSLAGMNYTWTAPAGSSIGTGQNSQNATGLGAGIYSVTVVNPINGCSSQATVAAIINTVSPTVTLSTTSATLSCSSPTIQIIATSSSIGPLTYTWVTSGGTLSSSTIFDPIVTAGTYTVFVFNSTNQCFSVGTSTIFTNGSAPIASINPTSGILTCNVFSIVPVVSVSNAPLSDLTFTWNPIPFNGVNSATATINSPGTYVCSITNTVSGCLGSAQITVTSNTTIPILNIPPSISLTCSSPTALITGSVTPLTAGINYNWSGPGITGIITAPNVTVNIAGVFTVVATNTLSGCSSAATTFTVTNNSASIPTLTIISTASVITCSPPTISLVAVSNNTNNIIIWSTSTGTVSNPLIANTAGTYTVTAFDFITGCSSIPIIKTITESKVFPTATLNTSHTISCNGSGGILSVLSSPNNGVSYAWFGPSLISGSNTASPTVGLPGTYSVIITDTLTKCSSATATTVVSYETIIADFTFDPTSGLAPLDVNFKNLSVGASLYSWDFGNGSTSAIKNPSTVYNASGTFTIMLISKLGLCSDTAYYTIVISDESIIEIPNVFTPNGDNVNDVFKIKSIGVKDLTCSIFDRWGSKVYEWNGPNGGWDGLISNNTAHDGTYFYVLEYTDFKNETKKTKGFLNIFTK
ncbi:MAG: gliding motility-associated C-terminal domain-containing protein [Bacteroidota bacterium]